VRRLSQLALLAGALLLLVGWWWSGLLPARADLAASVLTEPLQTATQVASFKTVVGDIDYGIQPVFDYSIDGLVVSEHDSDGFADYIHKDWHDKLNVVDFCVVWGVNASDAAYRKMDFSSGQFVCYFRPQTIDVARPEYYRALSNNHLLTDDPKIARRLRDVHVGDQIHLRGQLVEYSHHFGFAFHRGTSITRDDTGDGACETIFVREFVLLRRAPPWPRLAWWLGVVLVVVGIGVWFTKPLTISDRD
jgi:hypothetical protein